MSSAPPGVPPPAAVPAPPDDLDPLTFRWPAGTSIHRVHDARYPPTAFYPGNSARPGRFSPFTPARRRAPLPVLYGADRLAGALSETVFHDVPVRGPAKVVDVLMLGHRQAAILAADRDLALADLTGAGLRRVGGSRAEFLDSDPRSYPATVLWARALHAHPARYDGILWVSRQYDTARALMLFGDRVTESEIHPAAGSTLLPLRTGPGLEQVAALADAAGITLTGI